MWRCTLDVEFDKKNCFFLAEGPWEEWHKNHGRSEAEKHHWTMGSRLYSQYLFLSKIRSGCREVLELITFGPSISRFHNLAVATPAGTPGMHSDKRKCGEESANRGLMRLQETWRSARVFLRRNWIRSDSFANVDRVPRMGWTVASCWDPFKFLVLSSTTTWYPASSKMQCS